MRHSGRDIVVWTVAAGILALTMLSCRRSGMQLSPEALDGKWLTQIADNASGLTGIETMEISDGSKITDSYNMTLRGEDSGFRYVLGYEVQIAGTVSLRSDSLFVSYEPSTFSISFPQDNFLLTSAKEGADTSMMAKVRPKMQLELRQAVADNMKAGFSAHMGEIFIGRISLTSEREMHIDNNGTAITLTRITGN